jgi:hypothetical protein
MEHDSFAIMKAGRLNTPVGIHSMVTASSAPRALPFVPEFVSVGPG